MFAYHTQGPALNPYYRGGEEGKEKREEQKREEVRKRHMSIRIANIQKT